jgi:hypothetical protein
VRRFPSQPNCNHSGARRQRRKCALELVAGPAISPPERSHKKSAPGKGVSFGSRAPYNRVPTSLSLNPIF